MFMHPAMISDLVDARRRELHAAAADGRPRPADRHGRARPARRAARAGRPARLRGYALILRQGAR